MLKLSDLTAAIADKQKLAADLAAAQEQITTLMADLDTSKAFALAETARADGFAAEIALANTSIEALRGQVFTLEGEKKTVAEATVEQIAQLGVNASELPASAGMVADDPVTEYQAAIESGDKKKQAEIYATHKQALFAHARKNLSNG